MCTKIFRAQTNVHKKTSFCFTEIYHAQIYSEFLVKANRPNYKLFNSVDAVLGTLIKYLVFVTNNFASGKLKIKVWRRKCDENCSNRWVKAFKNRPSKICKRQLLKNLIGPFLNTLTQITFPIVLTGSTYAWMR